jgi:hypothetical protein
VTCMPFSQTFTFFFVTEMQHVFCAAWIEFLNVITWKMWINNCSPTSRLMIITRNRNNSHARNWTYEVAGLLCLPIFSLRYPIPSHFFKDFPFLPTLLLFFLKHLPLMHTRL